MTDPRRDTIAKALAVYYGVPHRVEWYGGPADAVLAALPKLEQVGWYDAEDDYLRFPGRSQTPTEVPVYIVREDTDG